jgi:hypothetical protein
VDRGLEAVKALGHVWQRDPERDVLADVPPGAETDDEPSPRDVVEQRRLLGEHRRMTERVGQDTVAQPLARHVVSERRHRRERFPAPPAALLRGVGDVVVHPDRFEHVVLADPRPRRLERGPVDLLRRGLDADRDAAGHRPVSVACIRRPVVTAPSDAVETSDAYFAMTPPV